MLYVATVSVNDIQRDAHIRSGSQDFLAPPDLLFCCYTGAQRAKHWV